MQLPEVYSEAELLTFSHTHTHTIRERQSTVTHVLFYSGEERVAHARSFTERLHVFQRVDSR